MEKHALSDEVRRQFQYYGLECLLTEAIDGSLGFLDPDGDITFCVRIPRRGLVSSGTFNQLPEVVQRSFKEIFSGIERSDMVKDKLRDLRSQVADTKALRIRYDTLRDITAGILAPHKESPYRFIDFALDQRGKEPRD